MPVLISKALLVINFNITITSKNIAPSFKPSTNPYFKEDLPKKRALTNKVTKTISFYIIL